MITRIYNLYAAIAAANSSDDAAHIMIQRNGRITSIFLELTMTDFIDADEMVAELSFTSRFNSTSNDAVGPIAQVRQTQHVITSGGLDTAKSIYLNGLAIPVQVGNLIYCNFGSGNGAPTAVARAMLFVA